MRENNIKNIISEHLAKYPLMEIGDVVRLIYQNEFGWDYSASDEEETISQLKSEMARARNREAKTVDIGGGLCRIHLSGFKDEFKQDLTTATILHTIATSSCEIVKGNTESYENKLGEFLEMVEKGELSLSQKNPPPWVKDIERVRAYLIGHKAAGYPMPDHGPVYRRAYSTSYRVALKVYYEYIKLFKKVEELKNKKLAIIAIDGYCGSGKSCLAQLLARIFGCQIISMDSFFLPNDMRNAERYNTPGANVHYERFLKEVVEGIESGRDFSYAIFDCSSVSYRMSKVKIRPEGLIVIEGSYSMREDFRHIYDLSVFLKTDEKSRAERLINRIGKENFKLFEQKWIPLENIYFDKFDVENACDMSFDT